jgi:hypothetical protein
MTDEYKPLYQWQETWPGEGSQDFEAFDNGESFGRIRLDLTTHTKKGKWKWNITHIRWVRRQIISHGGWEDTAREASRRVEDHYHKVCASHGRKGSKQDVG